MYRGGTAKERGCQHIALVVHSVKGRCYTHPANGKRGLRGIGFTLFQVETGDGDGVIPEAGADRWLREESSSSSAC